MKRINYINKIGFPNNLVAKIKGKRSKVIDIELPDDEQGRVRMIDRHAVEEISENLIEVEKPEKNKI